MLPELYCNSLDTPKTVASTVYPVLAPAFALTIQNLIQMFATFSLSSVLVPNLL